MRLPVRLVLLAVPLVGCSRNDPPGTDPATSASVASLPASLASLPAAAPPSSGTSDAGASAPADAAQAIDSSATFVDPGKLPQTPDKPQAQGEAWDARVASLWDAVVNDAPERAAAFFFPVDAYAQVKDIPNPGADWKARLMKAYVRDIHALHARLGASASSAKFLRIDVPSERATWVKPHEEGNVGSYWRVYGSQVHYEEDGKERTFDVKSFISWRGEWYVVHLSGFK